MNAQNSLILQRFSKRGYERLFKETTGVDVLTDDMFGEGVTEVVVLYRDETQDNHYQMSSIVGVKFDNEEWWVYGARRDKRVYNKLQLLEELIKGF